MIDDPDDGEIVIVANPTSAKVTHALSAAGFSVAAKTDRHTIYTFDSQRNPRAAPPSQVGTTRDPGEKQDPIALTVPQAARLLGISTSHAYQLVQTGDIPAVRLGRRVLIAQRSINQLLGG